MILDATAGNRTMWITKDSENIIYIDSQKRLEVKPTIFCDNTRTPFPDKTFDTIFYDPPQGWGTYNSRHVYPKNTPEYRKILDRPGLPVYYGWEIYKTRRELVRHIYKAGEEFYRILKDDGLLWLKWNVMRIPLYRLLSIFSTWKLMLRIYVKSPSQTAGKHQTFWLSLEKTRPESRQLIL